MSVACDWADTAVGQTMVLCVIVVVIVARHLVIGVMSLLLLLILLLFLMSEGRRAGRGGGARLEQGDSTGLLRDGLHQRGHCRRSTR